MYKLTVDIIYRKKHNHLHPLNPVPCEVLGGGSVVWGRSESFVPMFIELIYQLG